MTPDQFRALAKLAPDNQAVAHPFGASPTEHGYVMRGVEGAAGRANIIMPGPLTASTRLR